MAQETFEQTQRRLGLTTASAPTVDTAAERSFEPRKGRGVRVFVVIAGALVLGAGAFAAFQFLSSAGHGTDEWTTYPGTYFEETQTVLDSDSLEVTEAAGEELLAETVAALDAYGFEWSLYADGTVTAASNGYGGDSMLFDYESETMLGSAQLDDPGAREAIIETFSGVLAAPETTVVIDNDSITDDDAEYFFGSTDRDEQALWSAWTYGEYFTDLTADISVFDSTVATGAEFGPVYWMPEDSTDTVFVRISVSALYLLSEGDRQAFIAALEPYEGKTKPDYRPGQ